MLVKLIEEDFEKYIDFAYSLSQDQTKSGYPTYTDGIKTKKDFVETECKAFMDKRDEILLFEYEGKVEGWIHYFYIEEERYIEVCTCNINKMTGMALKEFMEYIQQRFKGYEMDLGFPKCNTDAISFLEKNGFECVEESCSNVFSFDQYKILPESGDIVKVNEENYPEFRKIHSRYDGEMYWNSDRIYADLDRWNIYLCYAKGHLAGAVYYMDTEIMLEIFRVDFMDGIYDDEIFRALLLKVLNEGKKAGAKHLTFFSKDGQKIMSDLGFRCVGEYVCYRKELKKDVNVFV